MIQNDLHVAVLGAQMSAGTRALFCKFHLYSGSYSKKEGYLYITAWEPDLDWLVGGRNQVQYIDDPKWAKENQ